jgi:hypothetical protein
MLTKIFFLCLSLFYGVCKLYYFDEKYKHGVVVFVGVILVLGWLVKLILSYLLPDLIISKEGIKILGYHLVQWRNITEIEIKQNQNIFILQKNRKLIQYDCSQLNVSMMELKDLLSQYIEIVGLRNSIILKYEDSYIEECNDI